jgi:hypothetical protein
MIRTSPWGKVHDRREIAPGITFVSTASHGGIHLSAERQATMREKNLPVQKWYEEDCEYSLVVLGFPQFFPDVVQHANESVKNWFPDEYAKHTGKPVPVEESMKLQERAFAEQHEDDYVVISASSHHKDCPEGMVLCLATKGGSRVRYETTHAYLVPKSEYNPGRFGFVIDENKHERTYNNI